MVTCTNCGRPVSLDFARAYGDDETVDWCPRCREERERGTGDPTDRS